MYCECNQYCLLQSVPFFIPSGLFSFISSHRLLLQQKESRPHFGLAAPLNKMALLALRLEENNDQQSQMPRDLWRWSETAG